MIINILNIVLVLNSIILIILILNQNETTKDTTSNTINTEISNPIQNLISICIFFELIIFLIKSKISEF